MQRQKQANTMFFKVFFFLGFSAFVNCKCFSKCELARELSRHGVSNSELPHWVCMATAESIRITTATHNNRGCRSTDYGIFQINSYYNCDPRDGRETRNGCGHPCTDFMDGDLADDVACIRRILGWLGSMDRVSHGYRARCGDVTSSYLSECGD